MPRATALRRALSSSRGDASLTFYSSRRGLAEKEAVRAKDRTGIVSGKRSRLLGRTLSKRLPIRE